MFRMGIVLAVVALAGCSTSSDRAPPGPPEYRQGYAAGCDSGYAAALHPYYRSRRDWPMYRGNQLYRTGWDEGYGACKDRYNAIRAGS